MTGNVVIAAGLLLGGAGYVALAWYVWGRRRAPAAYALLASLLAMFIWTVAYAIEMTTTTVEEALPWSTVKYVGVVLLPPSLLAFAVQYTGWGRHLTPRVLALLAVEPLIMMGLLIVPGTHDLVLPYYQESLQTRQTSWPVPDNGPLYPWLVGYNYVLLICALGLTVWRLARQARIYRRPAVVVIIAALLPFAGNAFYQKNFRTMPVDPTPFLFTVLVAVLVWGLFRMGLIDLVPIARSAVMEQMTDAVLILDAYNRVIDTNPAAAGLLGLRRSEVIGLPVDTLLPAVGAPLEGHRPGATSQVEVSTTADRLGRPGTGPIHLAVQLSSLTDRRGGEAGRLVVLRDVTQRTETEHRLRELLDAETHLAEVLQTSLRPASLPSVPRVRLAARSLPAGQGSEVSGDFYDVHQALGGDWAFVLGDVAGKGVHAAVVTSMARYTVRTLSAQGWSAKQVLEQLNQALLVEGEPERFCTVVYGRITEVDPDDSATRPPGVRIAVALGGHPAPLVRRADGRVEAIGRPGTALGIVSSIDIEEVTVDLGPGEVMVAFTDGVTEARRDGVEFGEERLAWTLASAAPGLRGHTGRAAAALVAEATADRVMDAVTRFAHTRDDIAVLVLAVA